MKVVCIMCGLRQLAGAGTNWKFLLSPRPIKLRVNLAPLIIAAGASPLKKNLANVEKYIEQLWQIHVTTLTNPCNNFGKSNCSIQHFQGEVVWLSERLRELNFKVHEHYLLITRQGNNQTWVWWRIVDEKKVLLKMVWYGDKTQVIFVKKFTQPDFQAKNFSPVKCVIFDLFTRGLWAKINKYQ